MSYRISRAYFNQIQSYTQDALKLIEFYDNKRSAAETLVELTRLLAQLKETCLVAELHEDDDDALPD